MSMRREFLFALLAFLAVPATMGQQAGPSASTPQVANYPFSTIVRLDDAGVTAPELVPATLKTDQVPHCRKWDGTVLLSVVIDPSGQAREIYFLRPTGNDLDKEALEIAAHDRFKPGSLNGAPVAVGLALQVKMEFCVEPVTADANMGNFSAKLRSQPEQTIRPLSKDHDSSVPVLGLKPNKGVMPPVPLNDLEPLNGNAECVVSVLIDEHGMPEDLKIVKSVNAEFDRAALTAVSHERYKPAIKDGVPIAVRIERTF
jgi:TonB family protein